MKKTSSTLKQDKKEAINSKNVVKGVELVERVCDFIRSNPSADLSLSSLELHFSLSRFTLQKSFKEVMGITPRKYVEECRINLLKKNLREGEPIPQAIYKAGYRLQSRLYDSPSSKLGMNPSAYRNGGKGIAIIYLTSKSKLGFLLVAETSKGICSVSLGDNESQLESSLKNEYPQAKISRSITVKKTLDAVMSYFDGQLLNLPIDIGGTQFQRKVWSALMEIPYGETRSYNEVAEAIGQPKAYRAVANACAANPVGLIIPCHRVVRKDGNIGGFGFGPERKKILLEMERKNSGKAIKP